MSGLRETAAALRSGSLSARGYCEDLLERIRERDAQVQAWAALDGGRALALAGACDAVRTSGRPLGALHGIPVGVKDIFDTDDLPTQMGSEVFAGNRPGRNAVAVERLIAAGGYVLGKTVTTEFAFMHPGKTRNPWNAAHTPGGSSSGSAAAVAAGFVPAAIGTQTNGSVIRPAAFCGVVGFKPTFGAIPYSGALQFSPTLDHVGVFARSVGDTAALGACLAEPGAVAAEIRDLERAPRIAFLGQFPWKSGEPDANAHLRATLGRLAAAGATVKELPLPAAMGNAHIVLRTIMLCEAAREHAARQARYRDKMSATLNAAIDEGSGIAEKDYRAALADRGTTVAMARDLFADCDAIASLPAPGAAPRRLDITGDPSFCTLWSLAGFPAITLPSGLANDGLPFGLQLAAPAGEDNRLLRVARWCEAVIGFRI
ncbi:MAG: amidase [Betaproteobacteria bacterium]|nr:amidase [Betaproteobacteria bacterium]